MTSEPDDPQGRRCTDGERRAAPRPRWSTSASTSRSRVDQSLCIEGCNLCVEVCPLDALAIDPETGKAYMHVDECWYCGPCADRCPTGAVTVNIPYLLR